MSVNYKLTIVSPTKSVVMGKKTNLNQKISCYFQVLQIVQNRGLVSIVKIGTTLKTEQFA